MDFDTAPDTGRETLIETPLDEITHEVARQDLRIGSREEKVHQVIHDGKILARSAMKTQRNLSALRGHPGSNQGPGAGYHGLCFPAKSCSMCGEKF